MKPFRYIVSIFVIAFALTMMSRFVSAFDDERTRETLKGIEAMRVFVADINGEIEKDGLKTDQIQGDVDLKIKTAGIRILTEEEWETEEGLPYLYVMANIVKHSSGSYVYNVDVQFLQQATLLRNSSSTAPALVITWSISGLGIAPDLDKIRKSIMKATDTLSRGVLIGQSPAIAGIRYGSSGSHEYFDSKGGKLRENRMFSGTNGHCRIPSTHVPDEPPSYTFLFCLTCNRQGYNG